LKRTCKNFFIKKIYDLKITSARATVIITTGIAKQQYFRGCRDREIPHNPRINPQRKLTENKKAVCIFVL
jgi:hypothetical protein